MVRRECEELLTAIAVPMEWEETEGEAPSAVEIGPLSLGSPFARIHVLESLARVHAHNRPRIASATFFVLSLRSPAGPTHEGHPFSHGQALMSSRVRSSSRFEIR
jgi:hypothetical protein